MSDNPDPANPAATPPETDPVRQDGTIVTGPAPGPDTYYPQPDPPAPPPAIDRTAPQGGRALDDADGIERRMRNVGVNAPLPPRGDPTLPTPDPFTQAAPLDPQVYPQDEAAQKRQQEEQQKQRDQHAQDQQAADANTLPPAIDAPHPFEDPHPSETKPDDEHHT